MAVRILTFLFLLCALSVDAAVNITLQATNMINPNPAKFVFSASSDSPLGGYVVDGPNTFSATVSVGQVLAPGNYSVYFKIIDYDKASTLTFSLAGTTAPNTLTLDDRDGNAFWSTNMPLTTTASGSNLIMNFVITETATTALRLMTIYVTSDTNEIVLRDNRVMVFRYPTTADNDNSAAVKGNRVQDSSFEAGLGPFDRNATLTRSNTLAELRSTNLAHTGLFSLRLPCPTDGSQYTVQSLPLTLASNKVHTVSCWARSSSSNNIAWIYITSFYTAPATHAATYTTNAGLTVGTNWTNLSVFTTNLPYYPNGQYFLSLVTQQTHGGAMHFDDIQVEEGTLSTYAPQHDFEIAVAPSDETGVFWTNHGGSLLLRAWNSSAGTLTKRVNYKFINWTNGVSVTGSSDFSLGAGVIATNTIALPTTELGHFRASFWITNANIDAETSWLMIKPPATTNIDADSYFGGLEDASDFMLRRLQRLGVKWQAGLSAGRLRWEDNEPTDNNFTWPDFTTFTNRGVSYMGVLNSQTKPTWIPTINDMTNYWDNYVSNAVVQYTNTIRVWQVGNEPPGILPDIPYYVEMLRIAATRIKLIDPTLKVVGGGGVFSAGTVTNIHALLGSDTNKIDYYSIHFYPDGQGEPGSSSGAGLVKSLVIDGLGKEVWNTESGAAPDHGSVEGAHRAFRHAGRYAGFAYESVLHQVTSHYLAPEMQAKVFLNNIGYGLTKMFYHDFAQRGIGAADFTSAQWTAIDYDDALRTKAASLAGMFSLIDKSPGQGPLTLQTTNVAAFMYLRGGSTPLVALWSVNGTNQTVTLSNNITASDIKVYDLMGNGAVPASLALNLTRMPILLEGQGTTLSALRTSVTNAQIAARTDTLAPQLEITFAPRVSTPWTYHHFRWLAIDDQYTPGSTMFPDGITYRHRVDGGAWTAWGGDTWVNLVTMPTTFEVEARDGAGNTSSALIAPAAAFRIATANRVTAGKISGE